MYRLPQKKHLEKEQCKKTKHPCICTRVCCTCGLHQRHRFEVSYQEDLVKVSVDGVQRDITNISDHDVLHTNIILPADRDVIRFVTYTIIQNYEPRTGFPALQLMLTMTLIFIFHIFCSFL